MISAKSKLLFGTLIENIWSTKDDLLSTNVEFVHGLTAVHLLAALGNHNTLFKLLASTNSSAAVLGLTDDFGRTMLHHAAIHKQSWTIRKLGTGEHWLCSM